MSKTIQYAKNGALIIGFGNALINLIDQLDKMNKDENQKFDWRELIVSGLKGAAVGAVGAVGGAALGAIVDHQNSLEEPINTDAMLSFIISNIRGDKKDPLYKTMSDKADIITKLLEDGFKDKIIGDIIRIGSTEEKTALSGNFDIDITVQFKPRSFSSVSNMIHHIHDYLEQHLVDDYLYKIREQKKSVGILFKINGEIYKIDIVPIKRTSTKKNKTSGYLHVKNDSIFGGFTYTKTDISSITRLKLTETQKKLLVALKYWKTNYNIPMSSTLLKFYILDAYKSKASIPRGLTKKILLMMKHIQETILTKKLISIENSNNVLTDIAYEDKEEIQIACSKVLRDYEYQPNSILKYFEIG